MTSYFGLAGPPGLPADMVKRLNEATVAMVQEPETIQKLRVLGRAPLSSTAEGFKARVAGDIERWTKLAADAGIPKLGASK